jgi:preprotein translocase subunit Sss1
VQQAYVILPEIPIQPNQISPSLSPHPLPRHLTNISSLCAADKREFLRISQAVGMGFLIMGVIGYIVKLSESFLDQLSVAQETNKCFFF